ncbi:MAG: AbrB/MazE/SpoVT family DNA-binding domain-containing protein [bacterium]|nr:AbrB/MazE/SpoVT family DNA-binding domain-containing protein [bacterium]
MNVKIRRKLFQTGKYSYVVTIPKDLVKELGWQKGDMLEVDFNKTKKQVIVKKFKF